MGSGIFLKKAINKYGIDKFKKEILYDFQTDKEMFDMEKEIVNEEFINRADTYNGTEGGRGSWAHTKGLFTARDKDNNYYKIDKNDPRYLSGELVARFRGKKQSQETIDKIKQTMKEHKHQQGENHSSFGKCYIYKLELNQSIMIKKEELEKYLSNGWVKGRKIGFDGKNNPNYGKCYIYNLELKKSISIKKEELQKYLDEGWVKGRKIKF